MHSSVQRARSERLLSDRANLARVSAQLTSAEYAHKVALDKAASLAVEVQLLQRQKDFLALSVDDCRKAFAREFFATCPEELLCYIFELLLNQSDDATKWSEMCVGIYDGHRARIPFIVSAVCTRWRKIALGRSSLWTYIGLPSPIARDFDAIFAAQRSRIDLLLLRSRSAPLEVLVLWHDINFDAPEVDLDEGFIRANAQQVTQMRGIFAAISRHVVRWRRASLWIPRAFDRTLLSALRGPTPALTDLAIICNFEDHWNRHPLGGFIPFAPRINQLRLYYTGILCSTAAAFPALACLTLAKPSSGRGLSDLLTRCASTLEVLEVTRCPPKNDGPLPRLTFPRLNSLQVGTVPYFVSNHSSPAFIAPCLRALSLRCHAIKADTVPFLLQAASTITHLTLHGKISASDMQVIAALANLTHFAMGFSQYGNTKYTIDDGCFVELARNDPGPAVWPKLRSITLPKGGTISYSDGDDAARYDGNGIFRLLANRNAMVPLQGEGRPCKLEEFILQYDNAALWLVAEVARLLSA